MRGEAVSKAGRVQPDKEGRRGFEGAEEAQARKKGTTGGSGDVSITGRLYTAAQQCCNIKHLVIVINREVTLTCRT